MRFQALNTRRDSDTVEFQPATSVPKISVEEVAAVLARFRGDSGDGTIDALRLRFAMTAIGMPLYDQRIILGDGLAISRADLSQCAKNFAEYSQFEYERCAEVLEQLDREDLSYCARPSILVEVLYFAVVADHRRQADHALKRAWDLLHLFFIVFLFVSSTYTNVVNLSWDTDAEASGLVDAYYALTVFFFFDILLSTQLGTRRTDSVVLEPGDIVRQKKVLLTIDMLGFLPLDFIFQAAGLWVPFMVFRCLKYVKIFRAIYLFEVVNTSIVTKGRLRFFYELKPLILGTYWVLILLQIAAVLHALADIYMGDEVTGERHWPHFIESYIIVSAAFIGSPADILCYNDLERLNVVALMLGTLVFQGAVISKFSTLLLSASVVEENVSHLRKVVSMMSHYNLPESMQRAVLSYQQHDLNDHASLHMVGLSALPETLYDAVLGYSKISSVRQVPLFAKESRQCQEMLAQMLQRAEFSPQEAMVTIGQEGDNMFMITFGYVEVVIATGMIVANLTQGDFFGELALFSATGKRAATVRALTYVDSWSLKREHLIEVCALYPEFLTKISAEVEARGADKRAFNEAVRLEIERRGPITAQSVTQEIAFANAVANRDQRVNRSKSIDARLGRRVTTFDLAQQSSRDFLPNQAASFRRDASDDMTGMNAALGAHRQVSFDVNGEEPRMASRVPSAIVAPASAVSMPAGTAAYTGARTLRTLFGPGKKSLAGIQQELMSRSAVMRRSDSAELRLPADGRRVPGSTSFARNFFPGSPIPNKVAALEEAVAEAKKLTKETIELTEAVRTMIQGRGGSPSSQSNSAVLVPSQPTGGQITVTTTGSHKWNEKFKSSTGRRGAM